MSFDSRLTPPRLPSPLVPMAQGTIASGSHRGAEDCAFEVVHSCSVVIFVIDLNGVFPVEREGQSLIATDRDGPRTFAVALQFVQP